MRASNFVFQADILITAMMKCLSILTEKMPPLKFDSGILVVI